MSIDVIGEILGRKSGTPCMTCSFQAEDMVVLRELLKHAPDIPVLFLDTGYHFAETIAYRDRMAKAWKLNLINLTAARSVAEQESEHGKLYQTQSDRCCNLRKVEPLIKALADYDIWFTGLRREQSLSRAKLEPVESHTLPSGKTLTKVSPLVFWTWDEVQGYLWVNEIEALPLYDKGYLSIGCEPCTSLPSDAANPRSGRWAGHKLECGIHTISAKDTVP